jgi:DegV family protein with EDD domain
MSPVAVVTDSTADFPPGKIDALDITIVPAYVIIGEKSYRDGTELSREEFSNTLRRILDSSKNLQLPKTSQPSAGDFAEAYKELSKITDSIISIHPPADLSGIFNSATLAKEIVEQENPRLKIKVIDSSTVSFGFGNLVMKAAARAKMGASVEEIERDINELGPKTFIYALVDDLRFINKGGRADKVDGWKLPIGAFLKIKTIVKLYNGKVLIVTIHRNKKHGIEKLKQLFEELHTTKGGIQQVAVIHAIGEAEAKKFANGLKKDHPDLEISIIQTGPALTAQVGPGVVAFGVEVGI